MAKKGTKSKKVTAKENAGTIAAIAGAAVAAVIGTVYFYGKEGKKHRDELKSWSVKAKADVMAKIEKTKELGEEDYKKIVDTVLVKYKKLKDVKNKEIDALADDLKAGWKEISSHVKKAGKAGTKTAKKTTKTTKKAAKKVVKAAKKKPATKK
jgi:hypothetical protein